MNSPKNATVNIGSNYELTILELAELIINKINPSLKLIRKPLPEDDPLKES